MTSTTLDILDLWADQDRRVRAIFEEIVHTVGYMPVPTIELAQLDKSPISRGKRGLYIGPLEHAIFIDLDSALKMTDAELAGTIAHELAHGIAGVKAKHGTAFKKAEREIIDRMQCAGMAIIQAPDQELIERQLEAKKQPRTPKEKVRHWVGIALMLSPVYAVLALGLYLNR